MTQLKKAMNTHRKSANFRLAMEFRFKAKTAKNKKDAKTYWKIAGHYISEYKKERE